MNASQGDAIGIFMEARRATSNRPEILFIQSGDRFRSFGFSGYFRLEAITDGSKLNDLVNLKRRAARDNLSANGRSIG